MFIGINFCRGTLTGWLLNDCRSKKEGGTQFFFTRNRKKLQKGFGAKRFEGIVVLLYYNVLKIKSMDINFSPILIFLSCLFLLTLLPLEEM
jgi:hypothetical protein